MKFRMIGEIDSRLNFYVNYGFQFLAYFFWVLGFNTHPFIFFVFIFNILYELKLLRQICEKIGNTDEYCGILMQKNNLCLSSILSELLRKDSLKNDEHVQTKDLFRAIIKYHTNIFSYVLIT